MSNDLSFVDKFKEYFDLLYTLRYWSVICFNISGFYAVTASYPLYGFEPSHRIILVFQNEYIRSIAFGYEQQKSESDFYNEFLPQFEPYKDKILKILQTTCLDLL